MSEHCVYCGLRLGNLDWNTEHVIPLSCGGNNNRLNKRKSHIKCNSKRGNLPWKRFKWHVMHDKSLNKYEKEVIICNIEHLSQFAEVMGPRLYRNNELYNRHRSNFSTSIVYAETAKT